MEFETAQNNTTAKLPILKLGEYEMWEMRIQQYFQVQDFALWEVIENGNSWVSVPQTSQEEAASVTKMSVPVTAKEKINKKNDVKARSLLLMALPNEHQLTFSQYNDAKTMYAAIKTRFRGNEASKKTQKALLKQQYENFNALSSESLDSIFNRLQKLVSRLVILGVIITPEDLNSKFLRSLPPEWNTHVVIWMNKANIETMSIDDLYNNFKIVEQEVKKSVGASTGTQYMAFMTTPSTSSTNEVNTANSACKVSTVNPNVNTASSSDLEQIHEDDLEAMDLKWKLSLLSMRAKRYFQRTGKKIFINANDLARRTNSDKYGSNGILRLLATYKRGLATVEDQLVTFRKNEVLFSEEIAVLKREVGCKNYEIGMLKTEFDKIKQEKEGIDIKIAKFVNASKCLDKLLESQITDKSKKGLGYHAIPPPHPLSLNAPTKLDLSYSGLDEFKEPEFNRYGPRDTVLKSTIDCDKESDNSKENTDDSLEKDQVSDNENSSVKSSPNVVKETVFHDAKKEEFVKLRNNEKLVKKSVRYFNPKVNTVRPKVVNTARPYTATVNTVRANRVNAGNPQVNDKGFVDSGCSRHMTGNIAYLSNFKEFDGGYVTFGGGAYGGRISGKGTLKTDSLDFDDVYFVKELKFNIFSVSQICDKKNYVLFIDTEYLVLSPNFKLPDENQILLRIPREDNMYSFDMKNIVPKESLTCLLAKATSDESMLWHRRLGHINFKNINKLVKENLVRGLPLKHFENDQTCVACLKGKQHRASWKKAARTVLADSKLPTTFWAEAVSTAYYVQNRVLIVKPHNKTPYEIYRGFKPSLSFMRPFGCHVIVLNTLDNLGKFDGKSDEGFFVGYSLSSKAFSVYNIRTKKVEENLHVGFLKNKPMLDGNGPKWLFDIDSLTQTMNYVPVAADTLSNESTGIQGDLNADERGIVIKNKARLVAQGHTQEEGINYDDVFAPVARIEAIRLFLAYVSFMGFIVYQMDVKSDFLYGTITEEVYVCQAPGFEDPDYPDKVYQVVKALYGLHQAPRAWYETLAKYLLDNGFYRGRIDPTLFIKKQKGDILLVQVYVDDILFGSTKKELCTDFEKLMKDKFQMSSMRELTFFLGLQVKQKIDGIFISQDKYVADILRKFNYTDVKTASTPFNLEKPSVKYEDADDVDVHLYRSMIGSLMYLTASRPDIMFAVCACARFQVTPKTSHLLAVKRIFRYMKDMKSTTGGCQVLGNRLISWQCKKQTIVATSTTKAEYVAAASCCGQVLWIQNQLLDYGYNFMSTVIYIDNNNTICIIENPVQHSKTKHIEIRHHFIRDCNAKKLIQMVKIHTDHNVADLLTKGFDTRRFQYLVSSIGMLNP
ncbi:retrovirus-related pol polyprotein from transposon TNT 1-94 [Tanacetum coccineum]